MRTDSISSRTDIIDSRDVIARIEELQELQEDNSLSSLEVEELQELLKLQEQAESSPDWEHGETLIRRSYFVTYVEELIHECYEMPQELKSGSGQWPWRHMSLDYEAAARELEQDYMEVHYFGEAYLIRS